MTYLNNRIWKRRFLTWSPHFRGSIVRLTRGSFSSVSFSRFRRSNGCFAHDKSCNERSSTQPLRSRNICIYICIENRKVYVENGVKCWNFTTR